MPGNFAVVVQVRTPKTIPQMFSNTGQVDRDI